MLSFLKRRWLSLLLGAICTALLCSVAAGTVKLYREGGFHPRSRHSRAGKEVMGVLPDADMQQTDIQPWMTFDYLNHVLNIPPNYLKRTFNITDPAYPKLQIGRYASRQHVDSSIFIDALRQAISNYGTN